MTNIEAAIGLAQLERADQFIARKRSLAERYTTALSHLPIEVHREAPGTGSQLLDVFHPGRASRSARRAAQHLAANGIETRPCFTQCTPCRCTRKTIASTCVAEDLAWRGINLPELVQAELIM